MSSYNLPQSVTLPNGTELKFRTCILDSQQKARLIEEAKRLKIRYKFVKVLARNLRGKTDLRGAPYAAGEWMFSSAKLLP